MAAATNSDDRLRTSSRWRCAVDVVRATAAFAGFCEHAEHNEAASREEVLVHAQILRNVAGVLARESGRSLQQLYADRILRVEQASPHRYLHEVGVESFAGADALVRSQTWADIQIAQQMHDRQFHPDVFGLPKLEQARHYTLHVAKLSGLFFDALECGNWQSFAQDRLADLAIFGVKMSTVFNERLGSVSIDQFESRGDDERRLLDRHV